MSGSTALSWPGTTAARAYLDTLSMSRATTHWTIGRSSLAKVAEYLGLPAKGDEVLKAKGKRLQDFTDTELDLYAKYCIRDTDLAHALFWKMRKLFPASELILIDMIVRMFILPQIRLNAAVLRQNYQRVLAEKEAALAAVAEIPREVFSSQPQFAALLAEHGIEVPMKTSPASTGKEIPALAKGDWAFKELCADDTLPDLCPTAARGSGLGEVDAGGNPLAAHAETGRNRVVGRHWLGADPAEI